MKLRRLTVNRMPGIDTAFELPELGDGFQIIHGPNGIGKSSVGRAVESLFWSDRGSNRRIDVAGEFELDGEPWRATREGSETVWYRGDNQAPAPVRASSHHYNCFFLGLRDLIDPSPDGTHTVAEEIRKQMSGGFDLAKISEDRFMPTGARFGIAEQRTFERYRGAVVRQEQDQDRLQVRVGALARLEAGKQQAEAAERRLNHLARARTLAARRQELDEVRQRLSALPPGLEKILGQESQDVDRLNETIEGLEERQTMQQRTLDEVQTNKDGCNLSKPIDSAILTSWQTKAAELQGIELELRAAEREHQSCRDELKIALSAIGTTVDEDEDEDEDVDIDIDIDGHRQLFEFLRASQELKNIGSVIDERIRLLETLTFSVEDRHRLVRNRDGVTILRQWLRAPESKNVRTRPRRRTLWFSAAALLSLLGVALALTVHPLLAVVAGTGLGALVAVFLIALRPTGPDNRARARGEFEKLTLDVPAAWELGPVEDRLRELEVEIDDLSAGETRARDRDVDRTNLVNQRNGLSDREAGIARERAIIMQSLKLKELVPDAELVDLARALDQLRQVRGKEGAAAGKVAACQIQCDERRAPLAEFVAGYGELGVTDAATALSGLGELSERNTRLRHANQEEANAARSFEQIDTDLETARHALAAYYIRAGLEPGDRAGLEQRLRDLPLYSDLTKEQTMLVGLSEADGAQLEEAGEAALAGLSEVELEMEQRKTADLALKADGLRTEIADIRADARVAESSREIEELIGLRETALMRLEEKRDEAISSTLGRFLIDSLERDYEKRQLPKVLERARSLFSNFTHHRYELRTGSSQETPQLVAYDTVSNRLLGLGELSDGTRVQLLLAARLAFAEAVESEQVLPLFLDEALDQSDPERYRAIVRSLGRIAQDQGRQIFYFTSDPSDVRRIEAALAEEKCRPAPAIDLRKIRFNSDSVADPKKLEVQPEIQVAAPGGLTAEDYGVRIGVTPFDPRRPVGAQHIFHILWDDLNLLFELLKRRVEWVGQWDLVSRSPLMAEFGASSGTIDEVALRLQLLDVFCTLWKQGRGRLVDRDVLEASGSVGEKYFEHTVAISSEQHWSGPALVELLKSRGDERLKGFQRKSAEKLEQFLLDGGYIDERPVLDEGTVRLEAMASPAGAELSAEVAGECLHRWWTLAARTVPDDLVEEQN